MISKREFKAKGVKTQLSFQCQNMLFTILRKHINGWERPWGCYSLDMQINSQWEGRDKKK